MTNDKYIFELSTSDATILDSYVPGLRIGGATLINSTIMGLPMTSEKAAIQEVLSGFTLDENSKILGHITNNAYYINTHVGQEMYARILDHNSPGYLFNETKNSSLSTVDCAVNNSSTIRIYKDYYSVVPNGYLSILVDRVIYFEGVLQENPMIKFTNFTKGSEGSTARNIIFQNTVEVNASNIKFYNCTFNNGIILNNVSDIEIINCTINTTRNNTVLNNSNNNMIKGCVFFGNDTGINLYNSSNNIIENNTIDITGNYTIIGDNSSKGTKLERNILSADVFKDLDSVLLSDITYTRTTQPYYATKINIKLNNDTTIQSKAPTSITVNVTDEKGNLVNTGYIEVYAEDILQDVINMTNGSATFDVLFDIGSSNNTIKVWYYTNDTYLDNVTLMDRIYVEKLI